MAQTVQQADADVAGIDRRRRDLVDPRSAGLAASAARYDVLVMGGGSAGVAVAVGAARRAEVAGRVQAWTYLEVLRTLPGWEHAYLVSTGPQFGTRESRYINSIRQLTWQNVTQGRRSEDRIALGACVCATAADITLARRCSKNRRHDFLEAGPDFRRR